MISRPRMGAAMDQRAIARWRMYTLRLSGQTYESPESVVAGLLGVQAENYPQASWAVATRTAATAQQQFQQQFDDGVFLRTHVLRPTWHFVRPLDIRWLIDLTAPRVRPTMTQLQRSLELDDAHMDKSAAVITHALAGGAHLTRKALAEHLRAEGLPVEGQRLGVMLFGAEQSALICSGTMQGRDQTYALLEERAPQARRLDRDDAIAAIVLGYFSGHGPATERDLSYWATMTLTDVRAGLAAVADQLDSVEHEGRTYWFTTPPPDGSTFEPRAHLLQTLDEYHNGYQDSRYVLDAHGIVPRGRRPNVGMAIIDGQMVGDMRRSVSDTKVSFEVQLYRSLDKPELEALHDAAARYGGFLGLDAELVTAGA